PSIDRDLRSTAQAAQPRGEKNLRARHPRRRRTATAASDVARAVIVARSRTTRRPHVARIVVAGGAICGLGTALLLARDRHDVTVLERDDRTVPESARTAWGSWSRKSVAQFHQPHNFMPGLRVLLEAEIPDVQVSLRTAGAAKFDLVAALPPFWTDKTPRPIV